VKFRKLPTFNDFELTTIERLKLFIWYFTASCPCGLLCKECVVGEIEYQKNSFKVPFYYIYWHTKLADIYTNYLDREVLKIKNI
jgi:hypothetical protein